MREIVASPSNDIVHAFERERERERERESERERDVLF